MKAIKTKFIGPTSTQPSRIKASAEGVKSKLYYVQSLQDETRTDRAEDWHGLAARFFQEENGWTYHSNDPANGVQRLASGQVGPDDHVHCFIQRDAVARFLQGRDLVVAQARILVATSPGTVRGDQICSAYCFSLLKNALEQLDALG